MMKLFIVLALVLAVLAGCDTDGCPKAKSPCCSRYGFCGNSAAYCDKNKGCRSGCWGDQPTTSSSTSGASSSSSGSSGSVTSGGTTSGSTSTSGGNGGNGGLSNLWRGQPTDYTSWNIVSEAYGKQNREIVDDPTGSQKVLKVKYPRGSYNPSGKPIGGTGFYANPVDLSKASSVRLNYSIYFDPDFDFVKGGKLPGLYAGHTGCSGGRDASQCISTRFMWRDQGMGESYLYVDKLALQDPTFCKIKPKSLCNPVYGFSIGRGAWTWKKGQWNHVSQTVTLGDVNSLTGGLLIQIEGQTVISFNRVNWRTHQFPWIGLDFETFFGGADDSWASTRDTYTMYKDFSLAWN